MRQIEHPKQERGRRVAIIILFAFVPSICCAIMCWSKGIALRDITPYGIAGNDEVIYQKMMEGINEYGMPIGYFGYNESHAAIGTFSTWSPVLLLFWTIWSYLFGWGTGTHIWCNIVLLMLSMAVFALLTKPTVKQAIRICMLYFVAQFISWHAFLNLPEIGNYFLIIIFCGLEINLTKTSRFWKTKLIISFVIAIILTWMRPYYLLLLLLPCTMWIRKSVKKLYGIVGSIIIMGATVWGYIWINRNMCAPYFFDLLDFSWGEGFFDNPTDTVKNILAILCSETKTYISLVIVGLQGKSLGGAECVGLLTIAICLIHKLIEGIKEKRDDIKIRIGIILLLFIMTYCAGALVFNIPASCKHFGELIVLGIFFVGFESKKEIVLGLTIAFVWVFGVQVEFYPCVEKDVILEKEINDASERLEGVFAVSSEKDNWDNTIIWVLADDAGEVWWQGLYAIPAGMGINLCTNDYIIDNYADLKAKWIYTNNSGDIDAFCEKEGAILVGEYGEAHIWKIR